VSRSVRNRGQRESKSSESLKKQPDMDSVSSAGNSEPAGRRPMGGVSPVRKNWTAKV
jgi:hypothetical protein